jgi:hypothetical protein
MDFNYSDNTYGYWNELGETLIPPDVGIDTQTLSADTTTGYFGSIPVPHSDPTGPQADYSGQYYFYHPEENNALQNVFPPEAVSGQFLFSEDTFGQQSAADGLPYAQDITYPPSTYPPVSGTDYTADNTQLPVDWSAGISCGYGSHPLLNITPYQPASQFNADFPASVSQLYLPNMIEPEHTSPPGKIALPRDTRLRYVRRQSKMGRRITRCDGCKDKGKTCVLQDERTCVNCFENGLACTWNYKQARDTLRANLAQSSIKEEAAQAVSLPELSETLSTQSTPLSSARFQPSSEGTHTDQVGSQEKEKTPATRASCVPCRIRKLKCDGNLPCKACIRTERGCFFMRKIGAFSTSCDECRRKREKCDGKDRCGRCTNRSLECKYQHRDALEAAMRARSQECHRYAEPEPAIDMYLGEKDEQREA